MINKMNLGSNLVCWKADILNKPNKLQVHEKIKTGSYSNICQN